MNSNHYDISIECQMGEHADLEGVEVSVSFPSPDGYTGADGSATRITRAGTLSIKTEEFLGWYSAELIALTHKETGDQSVYEVNRNFSVPHVDGDWVTFPVLHRG